MGTVSSYGEALTLSWMQQGSTASHDPILAAVARHLTISKGRLKPLILQVCMRPGREALISAITFLRQNHSAALRKPRTRRPRGKNFGEHVLGALCIYVAANASMLVPKKGPHGMEISGPFTRRVFFRHDKPSSHAPAPPYPTLSSPPDTRGVGGSQAALCAAGLGRVLVHELVPRPWGSFRRRGYSAGYRPVGGGQIRGGSMNTQHVAVIESIRSTGRDGRRWRTENVDATSARKCHHINMEPMYRTVEIFAERWRCAIVDKTVSYIQKKKKRSLSARHVYIQRARVRG